LKKVNENWDKKDILTFFYYVTQTKHPKRSNI